MQQQATFGAGCFWGVEWVYRQVPGVSEVISGFSGGHVPGAELSGCLQRDARATRRSSR